MVDCELPHTLSRTKHTDRALIRSRLKAATTQPMTANIASISDETAQLRHNELFGKLQKSFQRGNYPTHLDTAI